MCYTNDVSVTLCIKKGLFYRIIPQFPIKSENIY